MVSMDILTLDEMHPILGFFMMYLMRDIMMNLRYLLLRLDFGKFRNVLVT
jgi:hypothetical protein